MHYNVGNNSFITLPEEQVSVLFKSDDGRVNKLSVECDETIFIKTDIPFEKLKNKKQSVYPDSINHYIWSVDRPAFP